MGHRSSPGRGAAEVGVGDDPFVGVEFGRVRGQEVHFDALGVLGSGECLMLSRPPSPQARNMSFRLPISSGSHEFDAEPHDDWMAGNTGSGLPHHGTPQGIRRCSATVRSGKHLNPRTLGRGLASAGGTVHGEVVRGQVRGERRGKRDLVAVLSMSRGLIPAITGLGVQCPGAVTRVDDQ